MCDDLTIVISNIYQKSSADSHSHQRHSHVQYKTHDPTLLQLASHAYSVKSMALHCFFMGWAGLSYALLWWFISIDTLACLYNEKK